MSKIFSIKLKEDSKREEYFMHNVVPLCKDKVSCRLGVLFGEPGMNRYILSETDFLMAREMLKGGARK